MLSDWGKEKFSYCCDYNFIMKAAGSVEAINGEKPPSRTVPVLRLNFLLIKFKMWNSEQFFQTNFE